MKKIAFFVFFIFAINNLQAQTSLHFDGGYMFPLAVSQLNPYPNIITSAPVSSGVFSSWGKGWSFGVSADYKFNKYVDLELGVQYHYGASLSYSDNVGGLTNSYSNHLRMFVFSLGDIYKFSPSKTVCPYIGAGVNLALDDAVIVQETSSDDFSNTTIFNSSLTCTPKIGGYFKIGLTLQASSNFYFFGEITADILYLMPQQLSVNSVTQNGNNITNTLMPYQQQIDYNKSQPTSSFSQLQAMQETTQSIPASSWGINMGVIFNISKTSTRASTQPTHQ